ncbi:hypothetical protein [Maribacter sp. Asnod2-G09]|uniref:hypothetical protein n=1 Tax=Maribacter sp. Asnod2-G09 TaxID=3160577 RepID=UPI003867D5C1
MLKTRYFSYTIPLANIYQEPLPLTDTVTWTTNQRSQLIDKFKTNEPKHLDVQTDAIATDNTNHKGI